MSNEENDAEKSRVLIIDDDDDLVALLTIILKAWGYAVSSAGDSASGQQVCRKVRPHIILLDYHMPGDTGAHLFETFRRNQATARTPILFMSAVASPAEVLGEIAEPGFTRFLSKPVHMPDLRRHIKEMLHAAGN